MALINWMRVALDEAHIAFNKGEVPVGAVVVRGDRVIGRGHNQPISSNNPVAHAEIMALQDAAAAIGNYRLVDCELYVTLEPCTMCAGAIVHSRIAKVVFGALEPKAGALVSQNRVFDWPCMNHRVDLVGGVLEPECSDLVRAFFQQRRQEHKKVRQEPI